MTPDPGSNAPEGRMADGPTRHYRLQTHDEYGFYAGVTPDGRQVLMGRLGPGLVAFLFDAAGNLLAVDERPVPPVPNGLPYGPDVERIMAHIAAWQQEMGFRPATIAVKRFFSREPYAGIEDHPSIFAEVLADPAADDEEKNDTRESLRVWDAAGQFVLQWDNEYWLNADGEVESS